MRLLEAEVRTDSITGTASGASCTTQASSFSPCNRSRTFPVITMASIPNCLKQSTSNARAGSLISTRATRAEFFLLRGGGARTIPDDFCMAFGNALKHYFRPPCPAWQRDRRPIYRYQGVITGNGPTMARFGLQSQSSKGVRSTRGSQLYER